MIDSSVESTEPAPAVQKIIVDVPAMTVIKVLAVLALVYVMIQIWQLIVLILASTMLAAALAPYMTFLQRRGLPRNLAIVVAGFSVFAVLAGIGALVIPAFVSQTRSLLDHSDQHLRSLENLLAQFGIRFDLVQLWHSIPSLVGSLHLDLIGIFRSVVDSTVALLTVVFVTIYVLADLDRIKAFFVGLFPVHRRAAVDTIFGELQRQVGGYVRGELITSLLAAAYAFIVLTIAGIPNAIALAIFVGIADLVPLFGQTLGTIPAVVVALTVSPLHAIIVLIALVAYQQVENHYIVPRVYSNTMNVSALVALVGLLIGARLLGMIGVLLALPIIASLPVILNSVGLNISSGAAQQAVPEHSGNRAEPAAPDGDAE